MFHSLHTQGGYKMSYFLQLPVCLCEHRSSNTLCFILYTHRVDTRCLTSFSFLSVCVNIDPVTLCVSFSTYIGWIQDVLLPSASCLSVKTLIHQHFMFHAILTHRVDTRCLISLSFPYDCVNIDPVTLYVSFSTHTGWIQDVLFPLASHMSVLTLIQ